MESHNINIYHCVTCGRVAHAVLEAEPPQCCGHTMAIATEDTLHQGEAAGETPGGQTKAATPVLQSSEKPR